MGCRCRRHVDFPANDSYFRVVTYFGEMKPEEGYKTQTLMTLVNSLESMVEIFILSLYI